MATLDITGLDPAEVLAALHQAATPGALHGGYKSHPALDVEGARAHLEQARSFSYIDGRAMFLTIDGATLHTAEYDKRNGAGAAERALKPIIEASDRAFASKMHELGVPVP